MTERRLASARPRVLCVDDEPLVLEGLVDTLRRHFEVVTAGSGAEGAKALSAQGPFTVVVSDFNMPGMNGAEFLAHARLVAPHTVRVLLTGQASLEGAIAAVNEGNVFRFLTKPCAPTSLLRALEDAVEQARLETADRELLERKLEAMAGHLVRAERLASLGAMAGALGHDLNNILTAMASSLALISEASGRGEVPNPEDLATLEQVRAHLGAHAKNLLRLGRHSRDVELGRTSDLGRTAEEAVAMLRSAGAFRNVQASLKVPTHRVEVTLARSELEQVLLNLLKNAVEAIQHKGGSGLVEVRVELSPGEPQAVCTVTDTGGGIPKQNLPLIFEPYFTTKSPDQGTGLGLFVVKQVIERRGGSVAVETHEGQGTSVSLKVPLALAG